MGLVDFGFGMVLFVCVFGEKCVWEVWFLCWCYMVCDVFVMGWFNVVVFVDWFDGEVV